jgi:hypothetical protein
MPFIILKGSIVNQKNPFMSSNITFNNAVIINSKTFILAAISDF